MAELHLRISSVSIETMIKVLEATAAHPHNEATQLAKFAGTGGSTTTRALGVLQALALIRREDDGRYIATSADIRRGISDDAARQLLKRALVAYRPFEALCEGLALGEHLSAAQRKAEVLLGMNGSFADRFAILIRWGVELGLLHADGKSVALAANIKPSDAPVFHVSADDVTSEARSRLFVASRLGRGAYEFITETDRGLLAEAVLTVITDPPSSVEKSGQALENILREICAAQGLAGEAAKMNGAGQLGNLLASKQLIHSHQQKLVDSVGMFRNAKAHHKDKKTLTPWEITEAGSYASLATVMCAVRSIFESLYNGRQTL